MNPAGAKRRPLPASVVRPQTFDTFLKLRDNFCKFVD